MKPPKTIYLQCYDEAGELLDLVHDDVTSWCVDQINENDAVYVLAQAQEESRVRAECLAQAIETLEWYATAFSVNKYKALIALGQIEQHLAQLEPAEIDPCEGCGNQGAIAYVGNDPGSGNDLCHACGIKGD